MYILGLSGLLIDGAACLLKEGEFVAGIKEERPVRFKQASMRLSAGFPEPDVILCRGPADLSLPEMPRAPLPKPIPPRNRSYGRRYRMLKLTHRTNYYL